MSIAYRRSLVVTLICLAVGCSATPTQPTQSGTPGAPDTGPTASGRPWTVSGTVWIYGDAGRERARGGHVYSWIQPSLSEPFGYARDWPIDGDGRFAIEIPRGTGRVRVTGGVGLQPCALTVAPAGDVAADLLGVARGSKWVGANLPDELRRQEPTLSGVVYEQTPGGPRPIPDVYLYLDAHDGDDLVIATTRTDQDGRYLFCAVPFDTWLALMVGDVEGFTGSSYNRVDGRSRIDIELKRR